MSLILLSIFTKQRQTIPIKTAATKNNKHLKILTFYHGHAHSNKIEGLWIQVKRKLKAMNGTTKAKLPGYLDEFN